MWSQRLSRIRVIHHIQMDSYGFMKFGWPPTKKTDWYSQQQRTDGKDIVNIVDDIHDNKELMVRILGILWMIFTKIKSWWKGNCEYCRWYSREQRADVKSGWRALVSTAQRIRPSQRLWATIGNHFANIVTFLQKLEACISWLEYICRHQTNG